MAGTKRRRGAAPNKSSSGAGASGSGGGGGGTTGSSSKKQQTSTKSKATAEAAAAAAAAAAKTSNTTTTNSSSNVSIIWKIVQRVTMEMASSTSRSAAAISQSGVTSVEASGGASSSSSGGKSNKTSLEGALDYQWLAVATQLINRLLKRIKEVQEEKEQRDDDDGDEYDALLLVLSALCDGISRILVSDKPKLEKAMHQTSSRSSVGRALLSATMGALQCMNGVVNSSSSRSGNNTIVLTSGTAALDRLVHLQEFTNTHTTEGDAAAAAPPPPGADADADAGGTSLFVDWTSHQDLLQEACSKISTTTQEEECVTCLEQAQKQEGGSSASTSSPTAAAAAAAADSSTTAKKRAPRNTRRKSTTTTKKTGAASPLELAALSKAMEALLEDNKDDSMDARIAVKRWASMAIVWYAKGTQQLLQGVHHLATTSSPFNTPHELLHLLCRLLAIVAEAGTNGGVRPPVGGMDTYLKSLASNIHMNATSTSAVAASTTTTTTTTTAGTSDENQEAARADIRDWTVVAIFDILQIHRQCLEQTDSKIVNDTATTTTATTMDSSLSFSNNTINIAPNLGGILSSLCRAAAMSVSQSGYSEQSQWIRALTGITTALCFQIMSRSNTNSTAIALDCRLFQFAVNNLVETLRQLEHQAPSSSSTYGHSMGNPPSLQREQAILEQQFNLSLPLPLPTPTFRHDEEDEDEDEADDAMVVDDNNSNKRSTFAGMWPHQSEFTNEDALSLILRSIITPSPKEHDDDDDVDDLAQDDDGGGGAASKLISLLTELTRRAYDTRVQPMATLSRENEDDNNSNEAEVEDLDSKPKAKGGRKRSARAASGGRKTKKFAGAKESATMESGGDADYHRISGQRAILAKDALIALRHCLTMQTIPTSGLARSIRPHGLKMNHIHELIGLGDLLDKVLVKTRLGMSRFASTSLSSTSTAAARLPEATTSDPLSHASVHRNEFSGHEKNLWAAHMTMCQVLGRGQASYDETARLILTETERKSIVQSMWSTGAGGGGRTNTGWPLSLPAAHHAFLIANFTDHTIGPEHCSAEQLLVKQCIKSIGKELQSMEDLEPRPKERNCVFLDDGILLSYKDARTFLLAFSRLPAEQQRKSLEDLTSVILPVLKGIQGDQAKEDMLASNEEASAFVARVLVVCSAMLSLVAYGRPLRQALFSHAGTVNIQLPSFYSSSEWYYCERSYMGLFGDWECTIVPDMEILSPNLVLLKDKTITQIKTMLEVAFALGFETARSDQCYLLFAAWNGIGKLYSEGGTERLKPSDSTSLQINADNYPKRILQLRDDVCLIYNSGLGYSLDGLRTMSSIRLRSNLKSTLHRANILMGRLLETAATDETPSMAFFSLLASLPAYISASIAAHTKPGNDHFSTILAKTNPRRARRARGYSSESDPNSDLESVETDGAGYDSDVHMDAVSRLRECCDAFGAAPIHPDWLDVSCSFQEGIRSSDAVDNAETAMRMLNKLINTAFDQYQKNFLEALKAYKSGSEEGDKALELCFDLLPWNTHDPVFPSSLGPGAYSDERDWKEDISALCDLPEGLLDLAMDDSFIKNTEAAKESWCPNASQRLSGKLRDRKRPLSGWETCVPELRAGGEWELLLAESLTLACIDVKRYPDESHGDSFVSDDDSHAHQSGSSRDVDLDEGAMEKGHSAMKLAQIWHSIMWSATNHLLPAAALLRMGINKVGRKPHPFSSNDNNQDPYDVAPLSFSEPLGNVVAYTSQLVKITTQETMSILTRLSTSGDDSISTACHAIASHLFIDTKSFVDMEGLDSIRLALTGLKRTLALSDSFAKKAAPLEVFPFIAERLTLVLEDNGHDSTTDKESRDNEQDFGRLFSFFGASSVHTVDTIVGNSINAFEILKGKDDPSTSRDVPFSWANRDGHLEALEDLVSILCGKPVKANDRSRACAAVLLSKLIASERGRTETAPSTRILAAITTAFDSIKKVQIRGLILNDLCCTDGQYVSPYSSHRTELSHLLQYMMSANFKQGRLVHDVLVESFPRWPRSLENQNLRPAFDALLSFGCRFNSLNEIAGKILMLASQNMSDDSDDSVVDLDLVTTFFTFVKQLKDALSNEETPEKDVQSSERNEGDIKPSRSPKSISPLGRRCSFVEKTGYHGQHWYNCYTCGLVWEKGCCTLCALVCHKGHDVAYSRYSSFFCDCAAEDGTVSSQNRVSCRCMIQLPAGDVNKLFESESSDINIGEPKSEEKQTCTATKELRFPSLSIEIVHNSFSDVARLALADLSKALSAEPWFMALFNLLKDQFRHWKSSKPSVSDILPVLADGPLQANIRPTHRVSPVILRSKLRGRHAKPLDLKNLSAKTMLPIRSVKGFQTKMSSDTSSNAQLLAKLARNDISRCNLVSDSRGRMVLAEPCSLLFCSAVPAAATRYTGRAHESPLTRQQMCILGTSTIAFNIVGMRLCSDNERHLLVWGVSDACVVVVKPHWDGVETKIDLVLNLDQNDGDSDHIVKCEFVSGSQTNLVVGCGRYVRVFDISRTKDKRANAVVAYNLGFEASLRDIALVPLAISDKKEIDPEILLRQEQETISRMFMLLENGRLHSVDLKADSEGRMESPSDQPCELSGSVSLPTSGVRPRTGSPPGVAGSSAKSLGEASRIFYLRQSRMLLYKCVSSCVLALMLDPGGQVEGSFELIPHVISSDILWNGIDGHSIVGPYTHWTELGVVYSDNGIYFRVACIGRSSRTNQPKMICIEFNESDVRVKEIMWSAASSIGLSLSLSFEGLSAFSLPFVGDARKEYRSFGERTFLCTTTSAGSLLFFGEEVVDTLESADAEASERGSLSLVSLSGVTPLQVEKPVFPLTIFEKLKNVSDSEEVVFAGEGTGCDPAELKSRLLRDRSSSLICHRREGCTLSISLRSGRQEKSSGGPGDSADKISDRSHTIVALRVLVGSTVSQIPSKITIQGRPIDLTPRMKKWYSMPLTNEEIALGVRTGMISVGIGSPFDAGSSSSVDAIEVYVTERDEVNDWLQRSYIKSNEKHEEESNQVARRNILTSCEGDDDDDDENTRGLLSSVRALSFLCELCPESALNGVDSQRLFLRDLVEDTAFTRNKLVGETVRGLVTKLEPNDRLRSSLYDESILRGWMKTLADAKRLQDESTTSVANSKARWEATRTILRDSLNAVSKISRERPMNYLQCMGNVSETDDSSGSIALDASRLILEGARRSLPCSDLIDGPGGIIELCLTEIAIGNSTEYGEHLAKFDIVKKFLQSTNRDVAEVACRAVSAFCERQGLANQDEDGLFVILERSRLIAYRCDSCGLCPLKDIKYTYLEEDIDLCKSCFDMAETFAGKNKFDADVEVSIDGRTVGAESKLTCAQLRQMQAVPLAKMDIIAARQSFELSDEAMDEDEELQKALRLSLGENASEYGQETYENFVSHLFASTLEVLSAMLKSSQPSSKLAPVLRLLLDLIRNSSNASSQNDWAKRFAREVSQGIAILLNLHDSDGGRHPGSIWSIISCLRSMQLLLFPDVEDSASFFEQLHSDDDTRSRTHPDVVCDTHQIPAVRRRSAKGKNKDRRFYVCGKERGQRCNFFKWADDVESKSRGKSRISSSLKDIVRTYLWYQPNPSEISLNIVLCEMLENEMFNDNEDDVDLTSSHSGHPPDTRKGQGRLPSQYGKGEMERDIEDGVFCSREKLQDVILASRDENAAEKKVEPLIDLQGSGESKSCLLEACLGLLALVADYKSQGITRWFSLLCEIDISAAKSPEVRSLARKVLKVLCGKKRVMYHSIRDHFSFGFQLQALYKNAAPMLEAGLLVSERTRVCSPQWSTTKKLDWSTLTYGELIGVDDLITGADCPQGKLRKVGKVLDDLWSVIKNGGESWRRFCGHVSLPPSHRNGPKADTGTSSVEQKMLESQPVVALFWVACSLSGVHQIKALRLLDAALTTPGEKVMSETGSIIDEDVLSTISGARPLAPETLLLTGDKRLSIDDLAAFTFNFVFGGKIADLRKVGYNLCAKIVPHLSVPERGLLFEKILSSRYLDAAKNGKGCIEYLNLLQVFAQSLDPTTVPLRQYGDLVLDSFIHQIDSVKYDRSNGEWLVSEAGNGASVKKKFDLSECLYCLQTNLTTSLKEGQKSQERRDAISTTRSPRRSISSTAISKRASSKISSRPPTKWHPDQVSTFSRYRLDTLKFASSSDEFSSFFALRHRVVMSDISLTVNDPRGRFIKNVSVYYSSRPASDPAELKADDYAFQWQKCATLSLARGASRASASIPHPVAAANLKIEYTDFYERPGGSKASDGSLLVHCPRCTRVVTNAHGVCGNCGEVAFQCRKCRHINYDRLDAFLCVECGYCASGTFSLEVTAAVASNAIAIMNDKDCESAIRMLGAVNTMHDEVKATLIRTFRQIEERNQTSKTANSSFGDDMNRAFMGLPPILEGSKTKHADSYLDRLDKPGSIIKLAARPEASHVSSRASASADRTRSLLRLARQIRNESSGSAWDRRRSGDMIIRHLGRGIAVDNIEDERDLIGLLEDGNLLDSSDALTRTIANARAGLGGASSGQRDPPEDSNTANALTEKKEPSAKDTLEECQRLHLLMREAQRERYELKRRIGAWQRLNQGSLVDLGFPIQEDDPISTCHCSVCGSTVAFHLLSLWSSLFTAGPSEVDVDGDFLSLLLSESTSVGKTLSDCMREVVKDIATKSESGAKLVLEEVRKRLTATNDPVSAEILGSIMSVKDHFMEEEYSDLALELLAKHAV